MYYPVSDMGAYGVISDIKPHELPPNAFTAAQNMRFRDGYAEKVDGDKQAFSFSPAIAPYHTQNVVVPGGTFWVYAGLTSIYATDGTTEANVSRASGGAYAATADKNWTGCVLGNIPILNNGVDAPQFWANPALANKYANLTNWPSTTVCQTMRAFKNFLIAGHLTENGTEYPQMIRWSHPAEPGTIPSSWDYTDTTKDAGRITLSETNDKVIDSLALRDVHVIYKEFTTWGMQYLPGSRDIFRIYQMFNTFGCPTRRCAVRIEAGLHCVFTGDDLVVHDGQQAKSYLPGRLQRYLNLTINAANYRKIFMVCHYAKREVWLCYPTDTATFCTEALIFNWKTGAIGFRALDNLAHAEAGIFDVTTYESWDSDSATWESDTTQWDSDIIKPYQKALLSARPSSAQLIFASETEQYMGSNFTAVLERTGLGVPIGANKTPDIESVKFFKRFWPRITGTNGGTLSIEVGGQMFPDGPVTWQAAQTYTIGSTAKIDCRVTGRLLAFRITSTTAITWRLSGWEMEVLLGGRN